jgi:hypothetical protein
VNALLVGVMPRALLVRAVPYYRCYYLDSADRVASTDVIACDTDSQAQARADILLIACGYAGIEVWDRSRVVYRVRKTDAPISC